MNVDLILLNGSDREILWPFGTSLATLSTPQAVHASIQQMLETSTAEAWLFWDLSLGEPNSKQIERTLSLPGEAWHAGLRLGTGRLPEMLNFVAPAWMFQADPSPDIEATSWRLSLHACLIKRKIVRSLGNIVPSFRTLDAAALELGHRYLRGGVLIRHIPRLVPDKVAQIRSILPLEDTVRFLYHRCGALWSAWAGVRAAMTGEVSATEVMKAWWNVRSSKSSHPINRILDREKRKDQLLKDTRVTILIPTVDRYPYLRTLLDQLQTQSIPPLEIIIVDQTPRERRDIALSESYPSLPLKLVYQDNCGQCSARNYGLRLGCGDYVLFLDDDDEVDPTLIERHLQNLSRFRADVSCGVADEVGAGPLPEDFTYVRASDVFPTNNAMIRREVLRDSGLFDLAYDNGRNEDGDLGMRIYLSGRLMVLDPSISVLHHHAPYGGLRIRDARSITYASSRRKLLHRNLPSVSEIYLEKRYFTPQQVREMLWLRVLGTFSLRGGPARKALKIAISLLYLPNTLWVIRKNCLLSANLLERFPQIPTLPECCVD